MPSTERQPERRAKKTEIIAFSSGKGGTGKTLIAACLGYALTRIGLQVLMIDADLATDGLSLYLLGPDGMHKVDTLPLESTLTGILHQYKEQGTFQFAPAKINRSSEKDHGVTYQVIISGVQLYGDRPESSQEQDDESIHPERVAYRNVIQSIFESLRSKAEFDYVIVDTRGGFSSQSTDVSALADSYIVVTEADVTSFYQNRNLIKYIDQAAKEFDKKAVLRSIIVNKSTQFSADTKDFNLDNLESSFRLQLEREFPITYKDTHPFPLSIEALRVQKFQQIPIRHAPESDFSYAFFVAFHNILGVVTQPWTQNQVDEWNNLVNTVNLAIEARNAAVEKAEREEQERGNELEKLRKDNADYAVRISSLERERNEVEERYKRELRRSELIVSKLESEKAAPVPIESKQVTKPRRNLAPGIIGIFAVAALITIGMFGKSLFSESPAATPTIAAVLPTETPLPGATETVTPPPAFSATVLPTETITPSIETLTVAPLSCPSFDNNAVFFYHAYFVDDITIPDGTVLAPGSQFIKTWYVQNIGSSPWDSTYSLVYDGGERMGVFNPVPFPDKLVQPGECIGISINLTAPGTLGEHSSRWILRAPDGTNFGLGNAEKDPKPLTVVIAVQNPTPSP